MMPFSYCHSCCREKLGAKPRPIMQALMMPVLSAQRTFHQFGAHSQHFFGTLETVSDLRHLLSLTCTTLHHLRHFGSLTCDTLHGSLATLCMDHLRQFRNWCSQGLSGLGWGGVPTAFTGLDVANQKASQARPRPFHPHPR